MDTMLQHCRTNSPKPLHPLNSTSPLTLADRRQELIDSLLSSALDDLATFSNQCSFDIHFHDRNAPSASFMRLDFEADDADTGKLEEALFTSAPKVEPVELKDICEHKQVNSKHHLFHCRTDPAYALNKVLVGELSSVLLENQPALRALLPSLSNHSSLKARSSFMNLTFDDEELEVENDSLDEMTFWNDNCRLNNALDISLGSSRDSKMESLVFHLEDAASGMVSSDMDSWVNTLNKDGSSSSEFLDDEVDAEDAQLTTSGGVALILLSLQKHSDNGSATKGDSFSPRLRENVQDLLASWRRDGHGPIIHAQNFKNENETSSRGSSWSSRGVLHASPRVGEATIQKPGSSAFWGTELEPILKQIGCHSVCLVGLHTSTDVFYTTQHARSLGLDVIVPEDAVTDSGQASSLSSRQAHQIAIETLKKGGVEGPVAEVCKTADILNAFKA